MTLEESALQDALDANPHEQTLRIALADHLEDIGDPRADGYRAMASIGFAAMTSGVGWNGEWEYEIGHRQNEHRKPDRLHELTKPVEFELKTRLSLVWMRAIPSKLPLEMSSRAWWRYLPGPRRSAEDIVALAFLKLTDEQKADAVNFDPTEIIGANL